MKFAPQNSTSFRRSALALLMQLSMACILNCAMVAQPLQPTNPPAGLSPAEVQERAQRALEAAYRTNSFPPPRFESWPNPPPFIPPPQPVEPAPAETVPMPDPAKDKKLFSFRAENMDLKAALAIFARANKLNIVPDADVTGTVTLDIMDLPLERMMQALLEAHDFTWTMEEGLIRVRTTETRMFVVDYLRLTREGKGASLVTLSSSSSVGGGSGGGGGMGGGGAGGGGGGAGGASGGTSGSSMNLKLDNPIEFWKELEEQIQKLLTDAGKGRLAVNKTAGMIQVTDRPSALKQVDLFLRKLNDSVGLQVDIEAKLYDVTLNDQFQFGIDWEHVVTYMGGAMFFQGTPTVLEPIGGLPIKLSSLTAGFNNENTTIILTALQEQGELQVISQPRLRTLNNQTAIMKVGQDLPFWTSFTETIASAGGLTTASGDFPTTITVGTVLSITPQISTNGWIALDISPAISSLVEIRESPSGLSSGPVLDIKQASTLVRVRDGETIVLGGLIQNSDAKSRRKIPIIADIPGLGRLFQGRFDTKQRKELVIFLTPTIVK